MLLLCRVTSGWLENLGGLLIPPHHPPSPNPLSKTNSPLPPQVRHFPANPQSSHSAVFVAQFFSSFPNLSRKHNFFMTWRSFRFFNKKCKILDGLRLFYLILSLFRKLVQYYDFPIIFGSLGLSCKLAQYRNLPDWSPLGFLGCFQQTNAVFWLSQYFWGSLDFSSKPVQNCDFPNIVEPRGAPCRQRRDQQSTSRCARHHFAFAITSPSSSPFSMYILF